ncbi:MAG: hypothetical protein IT466_07480 [Moraxellaceae bacterium]|jgi:hypothetical protein|nr:hypothetical protein [Moraxellaceae bacterium]MBP7229777.1 hypothetical protein [Moraxellaceae bacterium]MBP9045835.1 hypothetical protein [Moraxellaceae bacterium]MBP9730500.1 hypothetical protein [Moraxellaceae bacterium]MCC6200596.1 hypothetical protein [Moraxellaceae bacterium]
MANDDYDDYDENAEPVDETETDEAPDDEEVEIDGAVKEAATAAAVVARKEADEAETLTVSSKEAMRRQLEDEVARFLAKGGKVQEIPPDVQADPPQKPVSSYGSKPI